MVNQSRSRNICAASILRWSILQTCCHHLFFHTSAVWRYFAFEVFFNNERADRNTESGTEAGIFDIYADGDFRIVVWCESYERRVVFSVWVLGSTGFAGNLNIGQVGFSACATCDSHPHYFRNFGEIFLIDGGISFFQEFGRENGVLN